MPDHRTDTTTPDTPAVAAPERRFPGMATWSSAAQLRAKADQSNAAKR